MKRYYVRFEFSTLLEAVSPTEAVRLAEKAMRENGYSVHWQRVDGTEAEIHAEYEAGL
jgi:hypothetical protein